MPLAVLTVPTVGMEGPRHSQRTLKVSLLQSHTMTPQHRCISLFIRKTAGQRQQLECDAEQCIQVWLLQVVMTPWVYEVIKQSVANNLSRAVEKHGSAFRSEFDKHNRNTLFDPKPNPYYDHKGNYPNDPSDSHTATLQM